jgi:hypothetical protein
MKLRRIYPDEHNNIELEIEPIFSQRTGNFNKTIEVETLFTKSKN